MIDPNEEVPKIAKPVETPVELRILPMEEFVEWSLSLPPGYKLADQEADAILKLAMQKIQPREPLQEP